MFLTFGVFWDAFLIVLALVWLGAMARRWRSDLVAYRATSDGTEKAVIAALWFATLMIAIALLNFVVGLVRVICSLW